MRIFNFIFLLVIIHSCSNENNYNKEKKFNFNINDSDSKPLSIIINKNYHFDYSITEFDSIYFTINYHIKNNDSNYYYYLNETCYGLNNHLRFKKDIFYYAPDLVCNTNYTKIDILNHLI